jgi:hypothetical protein
MTALHQEPCTSSNMSGTRSWQNVSTHAAATRPGRRCSPGRVVDAVLLFLHRRMHLSELIGGDAPRLHQAASHRYSSASLSYRPSPLHRVFHVPPCRVGATPFRCSPHATRPIRLRARPILVLSVIPEASGPTTTWTFGPEWAFGLSAPLGHNMPIAFCPSGTVRCRLHLIVAVRASAPVHRYSEPADVGEDQPA